MITGKVLQVAIPSAGTPVQQAALAAAKVAAQASGIQVVYVVF